MLLPNMRSTIWVNAFKMPPKWAVLFLRPVLKVAGLFFAKQILFSGRNCQIFVSCQVWKTDCSTLEHPGEGGCFSVFFCVKSRVVENACATSHVCGESSGTCGKRRLSRGPSFVWGRVLIWVGFWERLSQGCTLADNPCSKKKGKKDQKKQTIGERNKKLNMWNVMMKRDGIFL